MRCAGFLAFAWMTFAGMAWGADLPVAVTEYRAKLEKPGVLAEEILRTWRDAPFDKDALAAARAEVALNEKYTETEFQGLLMSAAAAAQKRAEAAKDKGGDNDSEPRHEESAAWRDYAMLSFCQGNNGEAVSGEKRMMEVLSAVATPEEWLAASLEMARLLTWTGDNEKARSMFELAKKLTSADGPLNGVAAAKAQLQAYDAWTDTRDPKVSVTDRRERMEQALEALRKAVGPQDLRTVACLEDLLALPDTRGQNDARTELFQKLIAVREATLGLEHPATIAVVARLGNYLTDAETAMPHLRRALDAWTKGAGIESKFRLAVANRVAIRARTNGDYAEAEKLYEQLVSAGTKVLGAEDRAVLRYRNDQAILMSSRGDYALAEKTCREVLEIRKRVLGANDPDTVQSMNNVAVYVQNQGRYREAEPLFREALAARIKNEGENTREALRTKSNIGSVRFALGDYTEAEKIFREVWDGRRTVLEADHTDTLSSLQELAVVALVKGDLDTAEQRARQLLEARERVNGPEHPTTVGAMVVLAQILSRKGDHTKALELGYRAVSTREARYGADDLRTIEVAEELGNVQREAGDLDGAEPRLRRAAHELEKRQGREHPDTLEAYLNLGKLLIKKEDFAGAEPLVRQALTQGQKVYDAEHPFVGDAAYALAQVQAHAGKMEEARTLAGRALAIAKKKTPGDAKKLKEAEELVGKLGKGN